ncbi:hypothetical protein QBC35DRAFT_83621 [Podospora australis]|uniref:Uncharacterized protein n=1 Tax=Podospora australis TaxID=1536484 RepID=A0AAN6WKX2_9PEZI|nr:hypothetical protein QBC35DRAFT_83621 [Podospora australis]
MEQEPVDLEWLADLSKGQSFTTCANAHAGKGLDFGNEGFTGSLSKWHELLQLTRPDRTCGLVFVRGQFPDKPGSILSRAQLRDHTGCKGVFGTQILDSDPKVVSDVSLGLLKAQGWINLRWPYAQFELIHKDPVKGTAIREAGSCETISFVSDGTVYQIYRLKWGRQGGSSVGGNEDDGPPITARFSVGGGVRFGCPCSSTLSTPQPDKFTVKTSDNGQVLRCTSSKYGVSLDVGLTVSGVPQKLSTKRLKEAEEAQEAQTWVDLSSEHRVNIPTGANQNGAYIVSTYTLRRESDDPDDYQHLTLPCNLRDYLGIDGTSVNMTDRLWTALCAPNYEAVDAVEFCVVGRCVEQILGITSVPTESPETKDGMDTAQFPERALIKNIMTYQYVDVESAFYQIRLLAKIYRFISTRELTPDSFPQDRKEHDSAERPSPTPLRRLDDIRNAYLLRLKSVIRSTLTWLFATDLKPGRILLAVHSSASSTQADTERELHYCNRHRWFLNWDKSYNRGCYATMAAWFVYQVCREAIILPEEISNEFVDEVLLPRLLVAYNFGISRGKNDHQPTPKANVLQWLHFSAILLLHDALGADENADHPVHGTGLDLHEVKDTQERFEKQVRRLKTSHVDEWSAEHDEVDRVFLLAEEMSLKLLSTNDISHKLADSRAGQAKKRIKGRRRTTNFHAGPKPWMVQKGLSNGPWELLCIHHEAYLRVADYVDVMAARDRLFEFLLSDYSFMTSWDRSDGSMVGSWWDIQPVAMICATLLDLKVEKKLSAAPLAQKYRRMIAELPGTGSMSQSVRVDTNTDGRSDINGPSENTKDGSHTVLVAAIEQLRHSMTDLHALNSGGDEVSSKALDWVSQQPGLFYHYPVWSMVSFHSALHNRRARLLGPWNGNNHALVRKGLTRYFESHGVKFTPPEEELSHVISAEDLCLLATFDIEQPPELFTFYVTPLAIEPPHPDTKASISLSAGDNSSIQDSSETNYGRRYNKLYNKLCASIVDSGGKSRIFFVQKWSPQLAHGFMHIWHPEASPSLDNHFGATSRFFESSGNPLWTTSITISHWTLRTHEESRTDIHRERHRQNGDFPPENVTSLGGGIQTQHVVEEQSSTLVITGDLDGHLWICSIWSPVTDTASIANLGNGVVRDILARFIHQPSSGRCLVFLTFLGHLCEKLAGDYNKLLARLDDIMEIGDRTLLEGLEDWWGTAEAINKLKKMLWGWEALRVFNDKLSASISRIQRAQDTMEHIIRQEAAQQDAELIQESSVVLDEFKKRYAMLLDVQDKTQLKIKQVTGLRDGISTITNVVDTQTALADNKTTIRQGNNIRTLTYITIAYLPLGLVIGLFSIQHGTFMNDAPDWLFAVLVVIFFVGTWVVAFILEKALVQVKMTKYFLRGRKSKQVRPPDHDGFEMT